MQRLSLYSMNPQLHNQNKPFAGATLRKDTVDKPSVNGSFIMEKQQEIWKTVIGYEGFYQVSNFGRVKSMPIFIYDKKRKWFKTANILNPKPSKIGYFIVTLCKKTIREKVYIHRLVADSFIPNTDNKSQVNHINGIKIDNRVENLEWVSCKENIQHAFRIGLNKAHKRFNSDNHYSKPIIQTDMNGLFVAEYPSMSECFRQTGIGVPQISSVISGRRIHAQNFKFKLK